MAEALWRLRGAGGVRLLSAVGDDDDGKYLQCLVPGLLLEDCIVKGRTSNYASVLDSKGECLLGLGDMTLHESISIDMVDRNMSVLEQAPLVVLDGNPPQDTIDYVLRTCQRLNKPVFFEPTDRRKAVKTWTTTKHRLTFSSPNLNELREMASHILNTNVSSKTYGVDEIKELASIVSQFIDFLIITMGPKGVLTIKNNGNKMHHSTGIITKQYDVKVMKNVTSVSGAGDCFASGFIYGMLNGMSEKESINVAFKAAKAALATEQTVPDSFVI